MQWGYGMSVNTIRLLMGLGDLEALRGLVGLLWGVFELNGMNDWGFGFGVWGLVG